MDFLSLKNDVPCLQKVRSRKIVIKKLFFVGVLRSMTKIIGSGYGSGSISLRHGSTDPDPDSHQNVMDPEHWKILLIILILYR